MPSQILQTEAFVLLKRPASDAFQSCNLFSPTEGVLTVLQRIPRPSRGGKSGRISSRSAMAPLDLFDEVILILESSNQGRTWFVRESRLVHRFSAISRDVERLRLACRLAVLVARNPPDEEGRPRIAALLRSALDSFVSDADPCIVFLKSLFCFARDEGHPVRQQWLAELPSASRAAAERILSTPLASQDASPTTARTVARLQGLLEAYLRGHTELVLD